MKGPVNQQFLTILHLTFKKTLKFYLGCLFPFLSVTLQSTIKSFTMDNFWENDSCAHDLQNLKIYPNYPLSPCLLLSPLISVFQSVPISIGLARPIFSQFQGKLLLSAPECHLNLNCSICHFRMPTLSQALNLRVMGGM